MKRIYRIFAVMLALMVCMSGLMCFAGAEQSEVYLEESLEEIIPDESAADVDQEVPGDALSGETAEDNVEPEELNILDRLKQTAESGKLWEMLSVAAAFGMLLLSALLKKMLKGIGEKIAELITNGNNKMKHSADEMSRASSESAAALVEFERQMMGRMDELCEKFAVQTVTHEQVEKLESMVAGVIEIFDTVYQGSSTIPAITKERIAEIRNKTVAQLTAPVGDTKNDETN